jgi:malate synthase
MSSVNQKHKMPEMYHQEIFSFINSKVGEDFDVLITKEDLLKSIRVCLVYYFHWFKGVGAVAFENLMEVSSTVEICRT